jgi:glucose-1-phosphate adenylyltransferase
MSDFIQYHLDSGAEITLMYTRDPSVQREEFGTYLKVGEDGRVLDIEKDPTKPNNDATFMEVFICRRDLLRQLVDKAVAHGQHDIIRDVLMPMAATGQARINAWEHKGPVWLIDSVQAFFRFNMDVLNTQTRQALFPDDLPVFTKVRDEMPARYGDNVTCVNSLVADGCIIEGTVENSILFRGVRIAPDAHVKNCIIMQDGQVHSGAYIENCILDKQAVIKPGSKLIGPEAYPIVIGKDVVI